MLRKIVQQISNKMNQKIQNEFMSLFLKSKLFKFFTFLRTAQGQKLIPCNQKQNVFKLRRVILKKNVPLLFAAGVFRIPNLKAEGMLARNIASKTWEVWNPNLCLNSSKKQVLKQWIQAKQIYFQFHKCQLAQIYSALSNHSKMYRVRWDKTGTQILIDLRYPQIQALKCQLRQAGFTVANSSQSLVVSYPNLNYQSPIEDWLLIFLKHESEFQKKNFEKLQEIQQSNQPNKPSIQQSSPIWEVNEEVELEKELKKCVSSALLNFRKMVDLFQKRYKKDVLQPVLAVIEEIQQYSPEKLNLNLLLHEIAVQEELVKSIEQKIIDKEKYLATLIEKRNKANKNRGW